MADRVQSGGRGARYSALLLVITGVALAGCVALAVGVTVRLVDLPRPRISAEVAPGPAADADPRGDLSRVDSSATPASDLAAEDDARRARASRQPASRSKVRHSLRPTAPEPTPSPTPTDPGVGRFNPEHVPFQPHDGYRPGAERDHAERVRSAVRPRSTAPGWRTPGPG